MRVFSRIHKCLLGMTYFTVLTILLTFGVGLASGASEPGTVTIVLPAEPVRLDPGDSTSVLTGKVIAKNVVETLTEINPEDSRITPRLATSWKQIDANTWQFFLRKGVKFHDGEDFNAEAVVANVRRTYDKGTVTMTKVKFFSDFKLEGKTLDSHSVELKADRAVPLLPTLMGLLAICSPNTPVAVTRNPIGTGPYKLAKWDAGNQIVLERFDGYWGKQPQVKKAVYLWRGESAVRAAMVEIGEADLAPNIAIQDAKRPDMDRSYFNSETTHLRIAGGWQPPLNDRRVRMALNYAVDRDALRSILGKDAVPASQLVVPSTFGYNPDLKPWPYDPKKAKQLLDEARREGVPVDREILLVGKIGHYPGCDEVMESVMTMYKDIGFNVKLRMLETGVIKPYERTPPPPNVGPYILQRQHDNSFGDAGFTFPFQYQCNGPASTMCDKTVDDLIAKAQVTVGEERRKLWQAAFKRIHEEIIPDVMLFHMVGYARVGKRIGFEPSIATNGEIQLAQITFK
jgi:peptide/nickel transport system substrate-binding protein